MAWAGMYMPNPKRVGNIERGGANPIEMGIAAIRQELKSFGFRNADNWRPNDRELRKMLLQYTKRVQEVNAELERRSILSRIRIEARERRRRGPVDISAAGQPKGWTKYLPIYGSCREAAADFDEGHWLRGIFHGALAGGDVATLGGAAFGKKALLEGGEEVAGKVLGETVAKEAATVGGKEVAEIGLSAATKRLAEAHIARSGKTVLGHFPGYIEKAKAVGASYFDIGSAWNRLSDAERWAANVHFLDKIAAKGDQVFLSLPKTKIRPGSILEKEVQYLTKNKGYRWINQWSLRKP